jgi:hypothetical protein
VRSSLSAVTRVALATSLLLAFGCDPESAESTSSGATGGGAGGGGGSAPAGRCNYTNPFSKSAECKQYDGAAWTVEDASADCLGAILGAPGDFAENTACGFDSELGRCAIPSDEGLETTIVSEGSDAAACGDAQLGCEVFAGGAFAPSALCEGTTGVGGGSSGSGGSVFEQPTLDCREPLAGEPAGAGPNGQVCTWSLISGCTEEGRSYAEYGACDAVFSQRPYYPTPAAGSTPPNDPRMGDSAYQAEVAWAREQVEACACVCCHSSEVAPSGASQWYVEAPGVWLDSISDSGLAMMAGLADSTAFGAFSPEENNGFDRTALGVPTTDVERMRALLLSEWDRRGFTPEQGMAYEPFGGPLADQLTYVPQACAADVGIDASGKLVWKGGGARYLYVLEASASNPGVPPNLDEPSGTVWLVDVPSSAPAFASGLAYGSPASGMRQRIPSQGAPPALVPGQTYYLYVLRDIAQPIARCLFDVPG